MTALLNCCKTPLGGGLIAEQGRRIGAKVGLFSQSSNDIPSFTATDSDYSDFMYFTVTK